MYRLAACPGEGITTVQVFCQGTVWKAEEAFWQFSVGKPSWQEIVERLQQEGRLSGGEAKIILEEKKAVVVALGRPEDPPDPEFVNRDMY